MERIPILEMKNVTKQFPGVIALKDVSLTAYPGECLALVGENGAGKSTLMKILSGAYSMDEGSIIFDGADLNIKNPVYAIEKGIGIVYQELSLIRQFTTVENLFLGRWKKDKAGFVDWNGMQSQVKSFYDEMDLQFNINVPVRELSIAQCQLIEITRAIFLNSKLIIMDEPTSSLTNREVDVLFRLINDLKEKGVTIIYISHRLEEVLEVCDRIVVLKDGKKSSEFIAADTNKDELARAMVGREISSYYPEKDYIPGEEVLFEVRNVRWGDYVRDISFQLKKGEILGFSGLVGSGRTETMRAIFKADVDTSGEIYLEGKKIEIRVPEDAIAKGIAFATEDRKHQGLVQNLSIAMNTTLSNFKSIASLAGVLNLKKEFDISEKYRKDLNIKSPTVKKKVGELSGGNQQKVVIAKWLNTESKVFIFDEPTRGIDVGAKAEIYKIMCELAKQGNGVIMVSSELPEILGVSDRVLVIHEGKITAEFVTKDTNEEEIMLAAVGGSNNG